METYLKFYTEVGEKYPEEAIVYHSLRGILRKKFILDRMQKWKGFFLEIGCNVGTYLNSYTGGPKVGVDISFPVLRRLKMGSPEKSACVMDAHGLAIKSYQFDLVLCSEVLEHLADPHEAMGEISRVLKPGGEALVTTPNYKGKRPTWIPVGVLADHGVSDVKDGFYFHTAFRPDELAFMGKNAGLEIVESGTLEKEVKYAAKLPALFFIVIRWMNHKTVKNIKVDQKNEWFFNHFQVWLYQIARLTGLHVLLILFVKEGVRSYVVLRKSVS